MRRSLSLIIASIYIVAIRGAPPGFPTSGNGLWYTSPGSDSNWSQTQLAIGNGYLAAMISSGTQVDNVGLNLESLWTGGPFEGTAYTGGNPSPSSAASIASYLAGYRNSIWSSASGTISSVSHLMTGIVDYGSYTGAGTLSVSRTQLANPTSYFRWLDLDTGIAHASWKEGSVTFQRDYLCSNPAKACVHHTVTSSTNYSATLTINPLAGVTPAPVASCQDSNTIKWRGVAPGDPSTGMTFEILARVQTLPHGSSARCTNGAIQILNASEVTIVWVGNTNYDMTKGNAAAGFTFAGADPHNAILSTLGSAATSATSTTSWYTTLLTAHQADYASLSTFGLNIGQKPDLTTTTDVLVNNYQYNTGNPYLEWLTFNFGRYLLWSSARGTLPAQLQGKWGPASSNPWGSDYHADINLQMNYWSALITNMDVQGSLFNYIENTWAPRGAISAATIYNITRGWVTHDEMNIFGYTGMKSGGAEWANYPQSAVWMMLQAWDQFDYLNDKTWFQTQGYPLLKGVAEFHLDLLVNDKKFNDGTLVTAPCNSPEQAPITLGCSHAQQLTYQLFSAIEKGFSASGDTDQTFLSEIQAAKAKLDSGIHIGSWGQLQEWKVDMDSPSDTHRHLSHLVGLYPGYAVSSYANQAKYTKAQVINAAETSLIHRGNGTGSDANAGWEKMWRAACWAQLANATEFYFELSYGLSVNYAANLFSEYSPGSTLFQIDANFAYPAAVMNALLQAPDTPTYAQPLVVTLLPALPTQWSSGSITNARVRGGMTVSIAWSNMKPTSATFTVDASVVSRPVQVMHAGKMVASFTSVGGMKQTLTSF